MFMENHGSCEDMGPSAFPVEEVHKISVLDIRMANADRHAGNILMSKGEDGRTVLIPIDHGYCFPESFEDCTFDWLYWPQARKPYNADTIEYIKSLDAEEDIVLLNLYGWDLPLECAHAPESLKKESVIEEIVQEALDSVLPGTNEAAFMEAVSHIEKIAKKMSMEKIGQSDYDIVLSFSKSVFKIVITKPYKYGWSTFDGLDRGNYPIMSSEGTGGAYFMLDALGKKYRSVFKPVDEEPMAVNNLIVNRNIEIPLVLENLLNSTFDGLDRGNYPIRSSEGTGGAYFIFHIFST
ncbi:hypothetical protein ACSBR2_022104 [Camellia fascicularis]